MANTAMDAEIERLKAENAELARLLELARAWMARQYREEAHKIAKKRTGKMTEEVRADFFRENQEEIIANRIRSFF